MVEPPGELVPEHADHMAGHPVISRGLPVQRHDCLLYTSDAADERSSVDLGGRRIIKKKKYDEFQYTCG